MKHNIRASVIQKIRLPKAGSRKGDNGRLLIIAGGKQYHGSLLFAVKAASRLVDLIYILTTGQNQRMVKKLKEKTSEFIAVKDIPKNVDCILVGPGMGKSRRTYALVEKVLRSRMRAVLDADALNVFDVKLLKLLNHKHILTPHAGEFKRLGKKIKSFNCTVIRKGKVDAIWSPGAGLSFNRTGNAGMTKGGTGDVLAGLVAGLFCKNQAHVAAAAGAYINGLAGDALYKKVGPYYDAEDLAKQIPKTLWRLRK